MSAGGGRELTPTELRALARRRLGRIAIAYFVVTAVVLAINVATRGPTWWYFAAGGVAFAIVMQALRLRR